MAKNGVPEGAIFEADLGTDEFGQRWALYDASDILPVNKKRGGYPTRQDGVGTKPKHMKRKLTAEDIKIIRVYNHHSGAKGKDGFAGLKASVGYSTRDKTKTRTIKSGSRKGEQVEYIQKGWPGGPYTFWLCVKADKDAEGRKVIYRGNKDEVRSYHTGMAANDHGLGVAWQGNLTTIKPSKDQYAGASVLFPHLLVSHELSDNKPFSWHAESPEFGGKAKPSCPGPHVEEFVLEFRDRIKNVDINEGTTVETPRPKTQPAPALVVRKPRGRTRHPLRRG